MHLPKDTFHTIIASTPLVSIDLIIRDSNNRILLGRRENEPARGNWFVPGGRIFKDEPREAAITRICQTELGITPEPSEVSFFGLYEHFYNTNALSVESVTTHYVVLAHQLGYAGNASDLIADAQHGALEFFSEADLLAHPDVHRYTKDYFKTQ